MKQARTYYRLALGLALMTALFLIWAIGALGIIGAGGRPDLMYLAVLGVGLAGTVLARLRPRGMAFALLATSLAAGVVALIALAVGLQHNEGASALEILGISGMYAALFAASAWLFWRAAEHESVVATGGRA